MRPLKECTGCGTLTEVNGPLGYMTFPVCRERVGTRTTWGVLKDQQRKIEEVQAMRNPTHWRDLPRHNSDKIRKTCPGCGGKTDPQKGGAGNMSYPIWHDGAIVGRRFDMACCSYSFFDERETPLEIRHALQACIRKDHDACPGVHTSDHEWSRGQVIHCSCDCHQVALEKAKARHPGVRPAARA